VLKSPNPQYSIRIQVLIAQPWDCSLLLLLPCAVSPDCCMSRFRGDARPLPITAVVAPKLVLFEVEECCCRDNPPARGINRPASKSWSGGNPAAASAASAAAGPRWSCTGPLSAAVLRWSLLLAAGTARGTQGCSVMHKRSAVSSTDSKTALVCRTSYNPFCQDMQRVCWCAAICSTVDWPQKVLRRWSAVSHP